MRIAVSSEGQDLSAMVDPRFGRAKNFIVYDTETECFEVVSNDQNLNAAQGAGVQSAQNVAQKKVDLVVSGNLGPKAFQVLSMAGIKSALWSEGTVKEAIELARNNKLKLSDAANVGGHWM